MTLSEELTWRGFVNQMTLGDITELDNKSYHFIGELIRVLIVYKLVI